MLAATSRTSYILVAILNKYEGGVVCGKSIMNLIGMNLGPCRLPIRNLTPNRIEELRKDFKEMCLINTKELLYIIYT